ncbi:NAD(P)-binding protein [Hyaloscypha variabilis F]|uniref:NAD(P)-binding protein n=1 Tax=Hyaloscypha variabilis (strain UAMH 11265 / GT02V1 / F) TaxID=1149755 RepID=A0A2J6QS43_HYAVF|nr:NAD(P)-binding protein [Hyaloscypha variabilis F]
MVDSPLDKKGISMFWWGKRNLPKDPTTSFAGKTILITGANVGLGFESAIKFAALGASSLIFGVRSLQRGEDAKKLICQRTGYLLSNIKLFQLDMSTFASVKNFADTVTKNVPRIDVAILNAGVALPSYQVSREGYEMTLQVNVLSTALLGILLLPKLRQTTASTGNLAHLEFVGSAGQEQVTQDMLKLGPKDNVIQKLNSMEFFDYMIQYQISKLLLQHVVDSIAPKALNPLGKPEVIVTTVCPGLCRTNLGREFGGFVKFANVIFQQIFARTCEEGSRTLVSGAALGPETHGEMWSHDILWRKGELVTSEEGKLLMARTWDEILQILRAVAPEVNGILNAKS